MPRRHEEWQRDGWVISTDPARIDLDLVQGFLSRESYWAKDRPREVVERSIANSLCFGLYRGEGKGKGQSEGKGKGQSEGTGERQSERQFGFARAVTDRATFAWVCDVFLLPEARGRGLGVWLMETVVGHPDLQRLRRILLATRDAHELYRKLGFTELPEPSQFMVHEARPPR